MYLSAFSEFSIISICSFRISGGRGLTKKKLRFLTLAAIGNSSCVGRRGLEWGKENRLWLHSSKERGGLDQGQPTGGQQGQGGKTEPSTQLPPAAEVTKPTACSGPSNPASGAHNYLSRQHTHFCSGSIH